MPLPMVDPPFPTAPPPTPVSVYGINSSFGGDEHSWGSSLSSASMRPDGTGFKADPSSPFRFPMDNNMDMDIGTVSPRDLHPELEYHNMNSNIHMPLTPEEMGMFSFSDAEMASLPSSLPAFTARRPLPSAASLPSNNNPRRQSTAQLGACATSAAGSSSSGLTATGSGHSSSKRSGSRLPGPRGSGSGSGRDCSTPESVPRTDPEVVPAPGHHPVSAGPGMPAHASFLRPASSFHPPPLPIIAPSNNAVADRSLAQSQAFAANKQIETTAGNNFYNIGTRSSTSSHRSSRKKSTQSHTEQRKSSPSKPSSSDRKKTSGSSSVSGKPSSSSHKQKQATVPGIPSQQHTLSFPPGQNRLGFVPIGCLGIASAAQGNTHPLDLALKKRIIVAERDAGLTYKAIQSKYTRWREAESTYRGLDRTARLPIEHRERVASWGDKHVSFSLASSFSVLLPLTNVVYGVQIQSMRKGMAILRDPMRPNLKGFPWKQLADHIKAETGKPFGATTVKKKWFEISAGEIEHETDDGEDSDENDEMGD